MGNIIRLLTSRSEDLKEDIDVFVDFENCEPSDNERDLWLEVNQKLACFHEILMIVRNYPGASAVIKAAIENYYDENAQHAAWLVLVPLANQLQQCYTFGMDTAKTIPRLLIALSSNELTVKEHLESQQALFKQFAQILDFILTFDDLKMTKPSIQNDFSFYRRMCSLQNRTNLTNNRQNAFVGIEASGVSSTLSDEDCSKISLFYAESTPMLKLAGRVISQYPHISNLPVNLASECLATMAHICRGLLSKPCLRVRVAKSDTLMLCLRVMTGVIILYDHVDPYGVFRKSSKLDVKSCLRLIKEENPENVECLLNAIRYSTIHFNDDTTPRVIKHLLANTA